MSYEQNRLIAEFLSIYVRSREGSLIPPDPNLIRDAICVMIFDAGWTPDAIRREALRKCSVMIPDRFFPEV